MVGYTDSDLAGDIDDRKSTTGVIYLLGENPVTWVSQKQLVVALSSCEAEYVAATTAACQGVWLGSLLGELRSEKHVRATLKIDDKSAIALTKIHYITKGVSTSTLNIASLVIVFRRVTSKLSTRTEEQPVDILTKPLGRQRFVKL